MALDSYRAVHRERSDIDLVRRANRGEASALETIYCKHNAWVFALAKRLTGNADDALDVRQDAFSYLFSRFPGFALTTTLRGFLFPVVRNLCVTILRQRPKMIALDVVWQEVENRLVCPPVAASDFERLVYGLSELQREVVMLRFDQHLSLQEIATTLAIPVGTAKSRLHSALEALRSDEVWAAQTNTGPFPPPKKTKKTP